MVTSSPPIARLAASTARVAAAIAGDEVSAAVLRLGDDPLLGLLADATEARNALDLVVAATAAEVARRSDRALGYGGLAQRKGHRNVTSLVQKITGQSRGDVTRAVETGQDLSSPTGSVEGATEAAIPATPVWLTLLRTALSSGQIGATQFRAIRVGLGEPPIDRYPDIDPEFLAGAWASATSILLEESETLPVEDLRAAARIARDRLDPIGVTLRFEERFEARSFRSWIDEAGQHHARIAFDDEAAAWVHTILRAALRPRRGPRFVDGEATRANADTADVAADPRSNEQLQYDTLIAVLRTGAAADPAQAFGDRQPGVRVIVEATAIIPGQDGSTRVTGVGHLEDTGQALPGGAIEKYLCDAGVIPVTLDGDGRPLDVGRERRLFTRKQRIAIAARDGGCLWPACTAPASEAEYHHLNHWWEHHGRTDTDDGVPLCRNCHLRLHNQGWRITRQRDQRTGADTYWLHPPADPRTGERGAPTRLASKSPRRFAAA